MLRFVALWICSHILWHGNLPKARQKYDGIVQHIQKFTQLRIFVATVAVFTNSECYFVIFQGLPMNFPNFGKNLNIGNMMEQMKKLKKM